jgi:proteasome accessory factor BC
VSHDADKLIRQLSLVAFLMAERRPLTARDVKGNVEGYSEMSDEAFARRFYSDRAELTALGVPLNSQRDEFTGEELYTLRSEHYFLSELDLADDELAALQTALYTLEGKFAYAEPLRLALQNLALGRPGFRHAPTDTAERVRVTAPDYSPELAARLSKLEAAISKQRTIQFRYWSPSRDKETERRLNPYALRLDEGVWYVVGHDLDRDATRTFRISRVRSDIRFATRRERDFRQPEEFDVEAHRIPAPWQIGAATGTARIEVQGDTAWWVHRTLAAAGTVEDGVFETGYASLGPLVSWILRQNGRAIPLEPAELRDEVADALRTLRDRHTGAAAEPARERRVEARQAAAERQPAGPVAPERFGVLQALLAHLLAACGDDRRAILDADELAQRFTIPREELQETLSLLNLVNFGGGCYTVYAEVDEETGRVRVDKELYGDVFRKPPKLTPLEARAIRLAIEYVGPTIAADAHTPLDRVRRKLEETFGQFDFAPTPASRAADDEEALVKTLSHGAEKRRLVELEYLKEGEEEPTTRLVEPYTIERELPFWRVHTWDRSVDGPRTYRLDRMRSAKLTGERFEPRPGFDPNYLAEPAVATLWHAPAIARWKLERGARQLTDKAALSEVTFKTEEWLLSEVLSDRGETVVIEPAAMRRAIVDRARALQSELGVSARRRRTVERA